MNNSKHDEFPKTTKQPWQGDAESIIKNFIVYQFSAWPNTIGRFSEAGLLECMRFVIFRAKSRVRWQRTSGPISE